MFITNIGCSHKKGGFYRYNNKGKNLIAGQRRQALMNSRFVKTRVRKLALLTDQQLALEQRLLKAERKGDRDKRKMYLFEIKKTEKGINRLLA
jgi:hypothetical protein